VRQQDKRGSGRVDVHVGRLAGLETSAVELQQGPAQGQQSHPELGRAL